MKSGRNYASSGERNTEKNKLEKELEALGLCLRKE
jgi:hypothetical protein